MSNIIISKFGTQLNATNVAKGSCSSVQKKGSFFCFSLRLSQHDIREYSFTNRDRAVKMRSHMIDHLERKILLDQKKELNYY
jgi:hypothetical protein